MECSDDDLGIQFRYPASQATTFLVSKENNLVHVILKDMQHG